MKDFKKMPKMACGGGVKKMQAGGSAIADKIINGNSSLANKIMGSEQDFDKKVNLDRTHPKYIVKSPVLNEKFGMPEETQLKYKERRMTPVEVPVKQTEKGMGLLKRGGKVKRGNKKK
jgi:hypothetical protein